ncbi:hypothetical protein [Actinoplanes rectilineatus]|uniref:hypothetical protein n=1 Tax=Actinoplanes rectilineatus TaxID=113571 RepID=UPI0012F70D01|nr:hypothetical protein [Actinoplanes rectilineatus]
MAVPVLMLMAVSSVLADSERRWWGAECRVDRRRPAVGPSRVCVLDSGLKAYSVRRVTERRVLLEIANDWPGSSIDGEPGIVSGNLEVTGDPDGSVLFSLGVGSAGCAPDEADYVEFVFSPAQADALMEALASRR